MREEICGDISKANTMENKKYEYAKSYSNHDGIVEILSVEINSENRKKTTKMMEMKKKSIFLPLPWIGLDWIY